MPIIVHTLKKDASEEKKEVSDNSKDVHEDKIVKYAALIVKNTQLMGDQKDIPNYNLQKAYEEGIENFYYGDKLINVLPIIIEKGKSDGLTMDNSEIHVFTINEKQVATIEKQKVAFIANFLKNQHDYTEHQLLYDEILKEEEQQKEEFLKPIVACLKNLHLLNTTRDIHQMLSKVLSSSALNGHQHFTISIEETKVSFSSRTPSLSPSSNSQPAVSKPSIASAFASESKSPTISSISVAKSSTVPDNDSNQRSSITFSSASSCSFSNVGFRDDKEPAVISINQ